ncbi:RNA polymerase factor sigma-32 [Ponticaulis koreensis]|uniref:RNA polymerase factor sigma-32 n=1 Tax=Ponticaulis koreensis TaxID=1123045 RepID=UPI0003B416B4|nr:RNA polymerase factor sigma-32 [Ponticaulis koreensis]
MAVSDVSNPGADRKFVKTAMDAPLLEQGHERELARRWREEEDEEALHELTMAYVRLVISIANRFRNYGLPLNDLIQEGNIGLMQAAARFDPERDVRFSTYATWWIRAAIQDYVLRNWSIVRTGTTAAQKSLFFNLKRLRAKIDDVQDASPSPEVKAYIAKELGVPERDVERMSARLFSSDRSLNVPVADDSGAEFQDLLPDEGATPEQSYMSEHDDAKRSGWISQALEHLNEREKFIIMRRRLTEENVTLEALGQELGVSKERVRQIEQAAMGKLKKILIDIAGNPEESGLLPDQL